MSDAPVAAWPGPDTLRLAQAPIRPHDIVALIAAAGCQDQKKPTTSAGALDLTPTPATPVYTAPAPAPVQPVTYDVPVTSTPNATVTPVAMTIGANDGRLRRPAINSAATWRSMCFAELEFTIT